MIWLRLRHLAGRPASTAPRPIRRPRRRVSGSFGVNATGYLRAATGVGESIRADLRTLQHSGVPFVVNDIVRDETAANLEPVEGVTLSAARPYAINLVHVNADQTHEFAALVGRGYYRKRYTIAYWAWELSEFPRRWHRAFDFYDEIWCLTTFIADAFSRSSPIPVVRMPFAVRERLQLAPNLTREHFGIPQESFVFLFAFDFASVVERKNPLAAVQAFQRAFPVERDVTLVLKAVRADRNPEAARVLADAVADLPVRVLDAALPRPELNALVALCDCYVSLHRAEGFGITLAEAMVAAKPVIATAYSGNMDLMTLSNSFPVKYRLVELERDYGPYPKGAVWANPDLDHAAAMMRLVYENRDLARRVGEVARQDIVSRFGPTVVGQLARERLLRIASFAGIPTPEPHRAPATGE